MSDYHDELSLGPREWFADACDRAAGPAADWFRTGMGHVLEHRPDEAWAAFMAALEQEPHLREAHLSRALVCLLRDEPAKAEVYLDEALRLDGDDAWALYLRGRLRHAASDLEAAIADLSRAAELRPAAEPYLALGMVLEQDGDTAAAAEQYEAAEQLGPGNPLTLYRRGVVLRALGRDGEAEAALADAVAAMPDLTAAALALRDLRLRRRGPAWRRWLPAIVFGLVGGALLGGLMHQLSGVWPTWFVDADGAPAFPSGVVGWSVWLTGGTVGLALLSLPFAAGASLAAPLIRLRPITVVRLAVFGLTVGFFLALMTVLSGPGPGLVALVGVAAIWLLLNDFDDDDIPAPVWFLAAVGVLLALNADAERVMLQVRVALLVGAVWGLAGMVFWGLCHRLQDGPGSRWWLAHLGGGERVSSRGWRAAALVGGGSAALVGTLLGAVLTAPSPTRPIEVGLFAGAACGVLLAGFFARWDGLTAVARTDEWPDHERKLPTLPVYVAWAAAGAVLGLGCVFLPAAAWPVLGGVGGALVGQQVAAVFE